MKTYFVALACCFVMVGVLAYAQGAEEGYQMARVVSFERVAANAQHMENQDNYKIGMRLGDTLYKCTANAPASTFMNWITGKEFPARVTGKVLQVKNSDGQIVELNIVGKKTPK